MPANYIPDEKIYAGITDIAIDGFNKGLDPIAIMENAWEAMPKFLMHCPEHHYLMAAALLAAYRKAEGSDEQQLRRDLTMALDRARNVLGGFCGLYGACGAAVGAGIFLSIFTQTTPYSTETWKDTTGITADCLKSISLLGGPRCCKRVCYTTAFSAADFMAEKYGIKLALPEKVICSRHEKNKECLGQACPYYKE